MDYKTMAEIVKSRGDRILEERRIRRVRIIRITSGVTAMCAAAIIGLGIWHSNTAKDPSSLDFNGNTTFETTAAVSDVTTVTSDNNNTVTTETVTAKTTAAAPVNTTQTSAAVTAAAVTQRTAVSTAVHTAPRSTSQAARVSQSTSVTAADVTVTTEKVTITDTHRRVYYMNKMSAGFAAMLVASSAISQPVNAVNDTGMRSVPFEVMSTKYDINEFGFGEWHKNETKIDVNKDGKFNVHDIYCLYRLSNGDGASLTDDTAYDYNNDGCFDESDVNYLIYYYTCYNKIGRNILDPEYYAADDKADKQTREDFVKYFIENTEVFHGMYDIAAEAIESNRSYLDVDGNGRFDMGDVMDIYFFQKLFDEPAVTYENMNREALSYEDKLKVYNELSTVKFPSESEAKCLELFSKLEDDRLAEAVFSDYLIRYYIDKESYQPEYSDHNYFDTLWESRYDERRDYSPRFKEILRDFEYTVEDTEREMGLPNSDVRADVDLSDIEAEYKLYKEKAEKGLLPEPDVNLDGAITFVDHYAVEDIYNNYRYAKNERYSDDIIDNFLSRFDLNENGISGDAADCSIAQIYICEKLGIKTKKEREYEEFRDAWINGEVSNYPWDGTNCLDGTRYQLTDPDDLFSLCENYVYAFTYASQKTRQYIFDNYYVNVEAGIMPPPDVNMNGVVDEHDYICAENTLYSQTHTSENVNTVPEKIMDNYIKNFDLDGSGVSGDAMDTAILLDYVSRTCGIAESDLETMAWNNRGQYTNTQLAEQTAETTTTAMPRKSAPKIGDANCDTDLDLSDAVIIMQALANPDKYEVYGTSEYHITEQGRINADVDKSTEGMTVNDALCIQQYLLGNKKTLE